MADDERNETRPDLLALSDDAVVKLLWLTICNIEDKRAREREKEKGGNRNTKHKAEGRLI